jgi:hypothetical protein
MHVLAIYVGLFGRVRDEGTFEDRNAWGPLVLT